MKAVIQVVKEASVTVEGEVVSSIDKGYLILLGIGKDDTNEFIKKMVDKIVNLRIFADENGKINLSIKDVGGKIIVVSQFTLYADTRKGNRPSFVNAMSGEESKKLYEEFLLEMKKTGIDTYSGVFGADMKVSLINDGPVTIIMEY